MMKTEKEHAMGELFLTKRILAVAGVVIALVCVGVSHLVALKQLVDDVTADDKKKKEDSRETEER